ncbi:MAG: hypothetical protein ACI30H_02545 [Paludibacteraceae bacterium]
MAIKSSYNGTQQERRYINIDALPGDPNTFWVGDSGLYYRTLKEAEEDNPDNAVNPQDYVIKKSFYQQHKKTIWICAAVLVVGFIVIRLFDTNKLVYNNHKW